jgi:hypothetical protein
MFSSPWTGHKDPEGKKRCRSTLSLTSALDGVGGQRHVPANLPPRKTRYPLYRRLGELQGWSGRVQKISVPPGLDPRTVQPVASRYTDWAIAVRCNNIHSRSHPSKRFQKSCGQWWNADSFVYVFPNKGGMRWPSDKSVSSTYKIPKQDRSQEA